MKRHRIYKDLILAGLVAFILAGLPLGIWAYNQELWQSRISAGAKVFSFTAHNELGWLPGRVKGYDVVSLDDNQPVYKPILVVNQGDTVVLKLTSADVIHGLSIKDFGIFIEDGIRPGKVKLVKFKADKAGVFTFSCNIICGSHHKNMQGTLIVRA